MPRILLTLLLVITVGCSRPAADDAANVQLTVKTTPSPAVVGENQLEVELPGSPAQSLSVEANMSHPGMAPVTATLTSTDGTHWRAPLKLTMAGDWFLIVRGDLKDGHKLERQVPLPGVVASP